MSTKPEQTKVAIVIPCYESAAYLAETVASVRRQTLTDWRVLIVDDGSTDNPETVVADLVRDDRRIGFTRQENKGVAAARNAGERAISRSEYLLFLDADDVLEPTMLNDLTTWLDSQRHVGAVYCGPSFIDERGEPITMDWPPRLRATRVGVAVIPDGDPVTPFVSIFCLAGIVPSLTVIRRSVWSEVGGWDETFGQHYEDTLGFLKLALRSEIHYLPRRLVRHRRHHKQSTADQSKFARQEEKLYERFRDPSRFSPGEAIMIRDAWAFRERHLIPRRALNAAARCLRHGAPLPAVRFLGGATRILAGSLLLGPGQIRS